MMLKNTTLLLVAPLLILFGSVVTSLAEVKRVEMHIAGYLCGN
jgi:hypothetical protein